MVNVTRESREIPAATGVQHRVKRLQAIGNGQVPQCAAMAWGVLLGRIHEG